MKIFLSHSSKNEKYALKFKKFLETLSFDIEVFCSSEKGSISIGSDFHQTIFKELQTSDIFIALLSKEYFESKYSMIELGVAFCNFQDRTNGQSGDYIFPFVLPPLSKRTALGGTPLANLQVAEINEKNDIFNFSNGLRNRFNINTASYSNSKLNSFCTEIDQLLVEEQNILELSKTISCCDMSNVNDTLREDDIIRHSFIDNGISVSYNLNPKELNNIKRPTFISLVMKYIDGIDIMRYLVYNSDASMSFILNNFTNSLTRIFVEFKTYNTKIKTFEIPLKEGDNKISLPLSDMQSKALSEISEICFVVHPTDVVEDEGTYKISNITIS